MGRITVERALRSAAETRGVEIGSGVLARVPALFREQFGPAEAVLVADRNTMTAAGTSVLEALRAAGQPCAEPFVFPEPSPQAEYSRVERLREALTAVDAVPVAVGSGTLNDLTKLAAHQLGRPYMVVATAASMDGYTAFGASITYRGSKQTFECPAPRVVAADLDVLAAAPPELGAAGYADLLAKVTAGADWLLADALGEEPVDPLAWELVQEPLQPSLADPAGVREGKREAVRDLTQGLMLTGLAMQHTRTSRPASGAEHQFSHLWDMEGHTHGGTAPAHGFKVGVATLAVARLYEELLRLPLDGLKVERLCAGWPDPAQGEREVRSLFPEGALRDRALEETAAKRVTPERLRDHLERLRTVWPGLRERLREQLLPAGEIARRLELVGAPVRPEAIGITRERLAQSHRKAYHLRRRYTVLDLAVRTGTLRPALTRLYGSP